MQPMYFDNNATTPCDPRAPGTISITVLGVPGDVLDHVERLTEWAQRAVEAAEG